MKRILFIIDSDPRLSHRPAEAVRIAAGIAVWKQVEVSVYFRGAAAVALTDEAETLVDGENFVRHLPILREANGRVFSGDEDLAALAAEHTTVARF
jgi:hypothetical protein